jgi:hypothetical protein
VLRQHRPPLHGSSAGGTGRQVGSQTSVAAQRGGPPVYLRLLLFPMRAGPR